MKRYIFGGVLIFIIFYIGIGYALSTLILRGERRTVPRSNEALLRGWGYDQDSLLRLLPQPREVEFASSTPELTLRGWYIAGADSARCGLVFAHGITENRANPLKYATLLRNCGCAMLLYDHRGHGASDGDQLTGGYYESRDVLAARDYLADEARLPHRRIGLVGESWGAAAVLLAAAQSDSLAFVLADSPYTSWRDAITQRADERYGPWLRAFLPAAFAWTNWRASTDVDAASPLGAAARIRVPTLIVHSTADTITPPAHSVAIGKQLDPAVGGTVLLDWGAWHAHNALLRPVAYRRVLDSFFVAHHVPFCR